MCRAYDDGLVLKEDACYGRCKNVSACIFPKAPCRVIVDTLALKRLPYQHFGVYAYTVELHGAFGIGI